MNWLWVVLKTNTHSDKMNQIWGRESDADTRGKAAMKHAATATAVASVDEIGAIFEFILQLYVLWFWPWMLVPTKDSVTKSIFNYEHYLTLLKLRHW